MKSAGFTLIELLVVIAIIALLGIVSFAQLGNLREDQYLKSAAANLQSFIKVAQTNAISQTRCGTSIQAPTWKIVFVSQQQINLNCLASDAPESTKKSLTFAGADPVIDYISGTSGTCTSDFPAQPVSINFAPLTGAITFSCSDGSQLTISLRKDPSPDSKAVIVKKGGSIEQ